MFDVQLGELGQNRDRQENSAGCRGPAWESAWEVGTFSLLLMRHPCHASRPSSGSLAAYSVDMLGCSANVS